MSATPHPDAPLDEALRRHYAERRLPESRVDRLLEEARRAHRRRWRPAWMTGVAAMLLLGLGGLHLQQKRADFRLAVLTEVAMNHHKDLASEFEAATFAEAALALSRLDIAAEPDVPMPGAVVTGARYCSIQGRLAGLIKLNINGRRHTLYVTSATDELVRLEALGAVHDGVGIRLWTAGGSGSSRWLGMPRCRGERVRCLVACHSAERGPCSRHGACLIAAIEESAGDPPPSARTSRPGIDDLDSRVLEIPGVARHQGSAPGSGIWPRSGSRPRRSAVPRGGGRPRSPRRLGLRRCRTAGSVL